MLQCKSKMLDLKDAQVRIERIRSKTCGMVPPFQLVMTCGCYDLLHADHVIYLQEARNQGDFLLVGVNTDASVSALKGPGRPVQPMRERGMVLAGLESVNMVVLFKESNALPLIDALRPDVWVKGGDYTADTINQEERRLVESYGGRIHIVTSTGNLSSSKVIQRVYDAEVRKIAAGCERPAV